MVDHNSNENHGSKNTEIEDDIYLRDKDSGKNKNDNDSRLSREDNEEAADAQTRSNIHLKTYESDGKGESTPESQVDESILDGNNENSSNLELAEQLEQISPEAGTDQNGSTDEDRTERSSQEENESSGRATEEIKFNRQPTENNEIRLNVQDNVERAAPNNILQSEGIGLRPQSVQEETAPVETTVEQDVAPDTPDVTEEVNSGPSAVDDAVSGAEDSIISGNVLTNDSDVDGTITVQDAGTFDTDHGSITINTDGSYEYTADADYNGTDSFEVTIVDDNGATSSSTLNLTVADVNDGPVAVADDGDGNEDSVISGNVLTNDSDVDGTIAVQNTGTFDTAHGSITINADGTYDYTADADYNGSDSFEYTVVDDDGATSTSTLDLTVAAVNDGPVIENVELEDFANSLSLNEDGGTGQVAAISGLDDFPTDAITIQLNFSSDAPPHASETNGISLVSYATAGSNNEFLLFAEPSGNVSAYINGQRISLDVGSNDLFDGESHDLAVSWDSATGEVSIYVDGTITDTATGSTGRPLSSGGTLVLGQEQDNVGGGFQSNQEFSGEFNSIEVFSEVRSGEEIAADIGKTPESGESAQVLGFDFTGEKPLNNVSGDHVFELNGGANVTDFDAGTSEEDSSGISGQVSASDVDGDDLSFSISNDPAEGSVSIEADGTFHFTPGNDFQDLGVGESREVSFEVEVADGNGGVDTQSVTVTVTGQNDGPTAEALAVQTNEDDGINGQLVASDIDGDDLSFSVSEQPTEGSVTINADGSFSFSPGNDFQDLAPGESRETSFSYQVSDDNGASSVETVTVTVNGTNDAPVIGNITNVVGSLDEAESIAGMAMSFNEDGRSGDVAMVQDMTEFPTEELTVELRFSSTEAPDASETNGVSLFSYNASGGENEFLLFTEPSGALGVYINGQRTGMDVDMNSLFDGDYHHVAVSWDSGSGEISVYIDGNLEDTATAQAGNPIKAGGTMTLGQEQDGLGGGFASNQEFSGKIADVQIFNEVRDAELIETDAATGGTATDDDSMVHAYDFRQSDDSNVTDQGAANDDMSYSGSVMVEDAGLPAQTGDVELIAAEDGGTVSGSLNASDAEGDDLTFSLVEGPTEGTVNISDDGQFEFDPGAEFQELGVGETTEVSFTYQVDDGNGGVESASATVTVTGSNDGPIATADKASGAEDSVISGNVLTNDSDVDGTITVQNAGNFDTDHGSITIKADGSFEYTPDEDYSGSDSFDVIIVDDNGATSTSTLDLTVNEVTDVEGAKFSGSWGRIDATDIGWQTDNSGGKIEVGKETTYGGSDSSNVIIEIEGDKGDQSNLYKDFDTEAGEIVEISFDYSARGGYGGENSEVEVYWDGVLIDTITPGDSFGWENHTYEVEGTGDSTRLEFQATDTNSVGGLLDNIQVDLTGVENSESSSMSGYSAETPPEVPVGYTESEGGDAADIMTGTDGNDYMDGGNGNDTMDGGDGNDILIGGEGKDELTGGEGNDVLYGGDANDTIYGGEGNDVIVGGIGDDSMHGGDGSDTLTFLAHQGNDVVDGGAGGSWTDTLELGGFEGQGSEEGWTLSLDDGSSVSSTDDVDGEMILSGDAGGTITFDDGGSVDFENIEKIVW